MYIFPNYFISKQHSRAHMYNKTVKILKMIVIYLETFTIKSRKSQMFVRVYVLLCNIQEKNIFIRKKFKN